MTYSVCQIPSLSFFFISVFLRQQVVLVFLLRVLMVAFQVGDGMLHC